MPLAAIAIAPGVDYFPGFLDRAAQEALREEVQAILAQAPLFRPRMPRTGKPFSVMMSNCGPLGWVSDEGGYRYQPTHPETGRPWPAMPARLARSLCDDRPGRAPAGGLPHQFLRRRRAHGPAPGPRRGGACRPRRLAVARGHRAFPRRRRPRGTRRPAPSASPRATPCRLPAKAASPSTASTAFVAGSSTLLPQGGRINLTLRRVTRAAA